MCYVKITLFICYEMLKLIEKGVRKKPKLSKDSFKSCPIYNLLYNSVGLIQEHRHWEIGCWSSIWKIIIKLGGLYTDV